LLVGGTVQMPAVQTWCNSILSQKNWCERPFEAIAQALSNSVKVSNFKIFSTIVTASVIGTTATIATVGIL